MNHTLKHSSHLASQLGITLLALGIASCVSDDEDFDDISESRVAALADDEIAALGDDPIAEAADEEIDVVGCEAEVMDSLDEQTAQQLATPVDEIVLPNGNRLLFFAGDGGMSIHELGAARENVSFITAVGEDVSVPEIWSLAAEPGREMPEQLRIAAAAATGDLDAAHHVGVGAARSFVAQSDPFLAPSWCTQPNNTAFIDMFCDDAGHFTDHSCLLDWPLAQGIPLAVTSPPTTDAVGGWCQLYNFDTFSIQYKSGCSGTTWVTEVGPSTASYDNFLWNPVGSTYRQYRVHRTGGQGGFGNADIGVMWGSVCGG